MHTRFPGVVATSAAMVATGLAQSAIAQTEPIEVRRVAAGLTNPLAATSPSDDFERLFVAEQGGAIQIVDIASGTVAPTPLFTVPDLISGGERGLLGLTFDPDYATNGHFYVNVTTSGGGPAGQTQIRRYTVEGDPLTATSVDASSGVTLLSFDQPQANHNGGWIDFGPDGYLYIATGDGGGSNDPGNNAQDITDNLLGKILRIDPAGDDFTADPDRNYAIPDDNPFVGDTGDDEIWVYGLRNPFRNSFDRETGDLYIGDVGQSTREEVNVQPAGSDGGENYGWRLREGTIATPTPTNNPVGGPHPPGAIDPIYDYTRGSGPLQGQTVTGGYVYRGPAEELQGLYIFGDFISGNIWGLRYDGSDPATFDGTNYTDFVTLTDLLEPDVGSIGMISSFGEDAAGNLYIVDYGGEVFMIVPEPSSLLGLATAGGLTLLRRRRG